MHGSFFFYDYNFLSDFAEKKQHGVKRREKEHYVLMSFSVSVGH